MGYFFFYHQFQDMMNAMMVEMLTMKIMISWILLPVHLTEFLSSEATDLELHMRMSPLHQQESLMVLQIMSPVIQHVLLTLFSKTFTK